VTPINVNSRLNPGNAGDSWFRNLLDMASTPFKEASRFMLVHDLCNKASLSSFAS
jgi:hypothetical protein